MRLTPFFASPLSSSARGHRRQLLKVISLLLVGVMLSACTAVPYSEPPEDIARQQLLEVPFFPQQAYYCGPAALAEVAQYRGIETDQEAVAAKTFIPGRQGSLSVEMGAASRQLGLLPYPLEKDFIALLRELDAGNPVLVLQNLGLSWLPQWHYALAIGYRLEDEKLILHSGARANHETTFDTFLHTWRRGDYWARVVVDSQTLPATAQPMPYLRSALAFEQTGQPALAYAYYQRAHRRWPDHPAVLTAAANAALDQGDSREARQLFERLLKQNPERPALWNNYAYALQAQGCEMAAKMAIGVAVQLAPDEPTYQRSAEDFPAPQGLDPRHCPRPDRRQLF